MLDKNDALALKHSVRKVETALKKHHKLLEELAAKYRPQFKDTTDDEFQTFSGGGNKDGDTPEG